MNFLKKIGVNSKKAFKNLSKTNHKKIKSIPSLDNGYRLKGGFIKQIISILRLNKNILVLYKDLDKDLVISGIIIKNIGLINYFNDDIECTISEQNEMLDSRLLGINLINDCYSEYSNFSQQIKTNLQNVILSENLLFVFLNAFSGSIFNLRDKFITEKIKSPISSSIASFFC